MGIDQLQRAYIWHWTKGGCVSVVKFKVIKGSHLLLAFSAILLAAVIAYILLCGGVFGQDSKPASAAEIAAAVGGARAVSAFAPEALEIAVIPDAEATAAPAVKSVLIYHTHTHEAYQQDDSDPYVAVETWRTMDENHSIVRVGSELARELEKRGFEVVHDVTDHECNELSSAYVRSLETLRGYDRDFDLIIDLHRDAYSEGLATCCTDAQGRKYAQTVLLVGRGDDYAAAEKPDYETNLIFARRLSESINRQLPDLCRNVIVKKGRYNQQMCTPAILLEIGHNMNTLEQALNTVPYVANAIETCLFISY